MVTQWSLIKISSEFYLKVLEIFEYFLLKGCHIIHLGQPFSSGFFSTLTATRTDWVLKHKICYQISPQGTKIIENWTKLLAISRCTCIIIHLMPLTVVIVISFTYFKNIIKTFEKKIWEWGRMKWMKEEEEMKNAAYGNFMMKMEEGKWNFLMWK